MTSRTLLITLVALAVIILLGGGYYYWRNQQNASTNPTGNQQQDPAPLPTDPTAPAENKTSLQVFFNKSSDQDCNKVYPLSREVDKTTMVGTAALKQLFSGPTTEEKAAGYSSIFSDQTSDILNSLQVKDGTAYVNLKEIRTSLPAASSSCGSAQFMTATSSTLKQFPTVKTVVYALDKDVEAFYEWVQIGCTVDNRFCENYVFKTDLIKVSSPNPGQKITSPAVIKGEARGTWFFEASFPIKILDGNGKVIGQGIAQADGNWMTSEFVPFTTSISFTKPATQYGVVLLEKDNPSGLAENADSMRLFVQFN